MVDKKNILIIGKRIYLKILVPADAGSAYLRWLRDPLVTEYLECRLQKHTLDSVKRFVNDAYKSNRDYLFGIYVKDNNEHIGNIKIGNINPFHRYGDIGIMIGDKKSWGKGFGSEALDLVQRFAFEKLKLHKVFAGIYSGNKGSYKTFIKCGFRKAGCLLNHRRCGNKYVDEIIVEKKKGQLKCRRKRN